ncbi:DUF5977 domain-containing protein [Ferruginibacter paludis]|uniref:DUF5977 domain-containing protein n=1 Tax=Ferruginibacter paludis TaxID=1310417 RepID=UPI0025B35D86|nr:DUF5977 domain-containing protein [Ferruginibacter paludis]MDN3657815.1 DUF5977 domain-containing protein [Ferruginibacter paludis]
MDPGLVSVATPQAASIQKFGRVPVDFFNGLPSVDVPIYKLPVKGLDIDIRLNYHAGGVKPNEKGGTVGVGWSLTSGGCITRVQNGTLDEHVNTSYSDSMLGYYWNRSQLNKTSWNNIDTMAGFLVSLKCGSGPCTAYGQWHDWAPDEFMFSVPGYSGSFWMDQSGNWQVKENNGEKLKITVSMAPYSYKYPTLTKSVVVKYCFQNFQISDRSGNTFVFGNDANSIEFNRNSVGDTWPATATSWYLTQIITSKGEKINFNYQRSIYSYSVYGSMNAYQSQYLGNTYSAYSLQALSGIIHDPVYLQSITYNKLSVQFTYSPYNIYYYSLPKTTLNNFGVPASDNTLQTYSAIPNLWATLGVLDPVTTLPTDYKLDKIQVSYNSAQTMSFGFAYYDSTVANRLFLKTLNFGTVKWPLIYQFNYNGMNFSNYCDGKIEDGILTTKIDHWGYYTGKFPMKTSVLPSTNGQYNNPYAPPSGNGGFPNEDFINTYYTNRQPVFDSAKIGSLASITYPTGGYTNFIYEPHDYSSQINPANYQTNFLSTNTTAGGLRIKEIDSYSDANAIPTVKKYQYKNDNGFSSGILNSAGILYRDSVNAADMTGTIIMRYFYDRNLMPLQNTNGNHVTYSKVDELNADGSKTSYRYNNYDNGHGDILPSAFLSTTISANYFMQPNSRNFQRGKLIAQTNYDSAKNIVSRDTINYINDDAITSNRVGIRSYSFKSKDIKMYSFASAHQVGTVNIWTSNVTPFVYYTHFYPTIQKASTYYQSPDSIKTIETFAYNDSNNKVMQDTLKNLSDGSSKITSIKYPSDFPGNTFYSNMVNQNIKDPAIMITKSNQLGKILMVSKDSLKLNTTNNGSFYWPFEKDQYQVSSDIIKTNILQYDSIGNPVDVIGPDSIATCYLWDYSSLYPVAVVKNANNASVAYTSFEGEGKGNWVLPDNNYITASLTGNQGYVLNSTKTITATVPSGKQYFVSYWAKNGSATVKSNGGTVSASTPAGLTKQGWTYYEHLLPTTTTAVNVTAAAIDTVDELRLYPSKAMMTTYTYSPTFGVASTCSPSNSIVKYEWDAGIPRLKRIWDMDNNILKQFDYKYQMLAVPFYNAPLSRVYNKNDCGSALLGSAVTYNVPGGTYSSNISQLDADNQATTDTTTNGQAYANAHGVCGASVSGFDYSSGTGGFIATFTLFGGGAVYSFPIDILHPGKIGFIPAGKYSLTIAKPGNTTSYTFSAGCTLTTTGTSATFGSVVIGVNLCSPIFNLTIQ